MGHAKEKEEHRIIMCITAQKAALRQPTRMTAAASAAAALNAGVIERDVLSTQPTLRDTKAIPNGTVHQSP